MTRLADIWSTFIGSSHTIFELAYCERGSKTWTSTPHSPSKLLGRPLVKRSWMARATLSVGGGGCGGGGGGGTGGGEGVSGGSGGNGGIGGGVGGEGSRPKATTSEMKNHPGAALCAPPCVVSLSCTRWPVNPASPQCTLTYGSCGVLSRIAIGAPHARPSTSTRTGLWLAGPHALLTYTATLATRAGSRRCRSSHWGSDVQAPT